MLRFAFRKKVDWPYPLRLPEISNCRRMSATIEQLEAAIGALETQRGLLGDAVVDAGTAPMREKRALMRSQTRIRSQ